MKKIINDKLEIEKGKFTELDYISPAYINKKNPKYLEIDNLKYSGILIINYNREHYDLILKDLIETILKISENGEITNIVAIVIVKELP